MNQISKARLKQLRERYTLGTRVRLIQMDDIQAPPVNTLGTVICVDDIGSIIVQWDNGSSLNILDGIDKCSVLGNEDNYGENC